MKAVAHSRYVRVTPQKARRVMREVRGLPANRALDILRFAPQKPALSIRKTLVSALANAEQAARKDGKSFDTDEMFVIEAYVNEGPTMKRFRARAQGRGARILKRTSHITMVVGDVEDKKEIASPWKKEVRTAKTVAAERAAAKATRTDTASGAKSDVKDTDKSEEKAAASKSSAKSSSKSGAKKTTTAKKSPAEKKTTSSKSSTSKTADKDKAPKKTAAKKAPAKSAAEPNDTEKGAK